MPSRKLAAEKLAELMSSLSRPDRLRIVLELRSGEKDVTELTEILNLAQPTVSQHLAALRLHHLVEQRREGHHVYYHLANPQVADWVMEAFHFTESEVVGIAKVKAAMKEAKSIWSKNKRRA
jgi:DNA-binding transcriptional ArsR family regulator